jgi:Protein of unknown function (DUF1579)
VVGLASEGGRQAMRVSPFVSVSLILAVAIAPIVAEDSKPPKPGPEVAQLAAFLGTWKGKADVKESPYGPAGKMSWTETCDWFEGGFQLVCKSNADTPRGKLQGMSILSWDPDAASYLYHNIDNAGGSNIAEGSVTSGGTWTFGSERAMGKQVVRSRYIIQHPTPTTMKYTFEMQRETGGWTLVSEGSSEKKTK